MSRPVLAPEEFLKRILAQDLEARSSYRACYLSSVEGIVTDPRLMLLSLDDHMVHRGDGIFEALKVVGQKPYLLREHLDRLQKSAELISLKLPVSRSELEELIFETLKASKLEEALIRIFVSRGTGSFGTNPYDCKKSGLSIVATEFKRVPEAYYLNGVKIGRSQISPKSEQWAQIKSCNYLPNVLMKKESVDRALDFTVGFDEAGFLTESSTENIILIDQRGRLARPFLKRILKGCTMTRILNLVAQQNWLTPVEENISEEDILRAQEVMMVGTTLDILPVVEYEGHKIGNGKVGAGAQKLLQILRNDQL
jgi:4-amino-4-deoxychorismate lyase